MKSISCVQFLATPWTAAHQAPPSTGFFQARVLEWGSIATNYINQYTARDTVGKGYGNLAANYMAQQVKNPSPIQFLINLLTAQRNLFLDSLEHLMPLTVGRL